MQDQPFLIDSLHGAYAGGLEPAAVIAEVYRRIEAAGDEGIFLHLIEPQCAMAEAATLGPFDPVAKPLWGIPFAVKDNIDVAGAPTTAACPAYRYTAERDAFVVEALRRAGALLVGKTNLDQFATGLVGVRTPYPVPKNALDPAIVPGGSSAGSAVAVARGLVSFALGTDTAGSGRVPAALNGIVGLKPTLGALSNSGVVPACRTLDTVSVFALTVDDAYRAYRQAAQYDAGDSYARPIATPPLAAPPPACRVGVPDHHTRQFFGDTAQAESFEAAIDSLAALGAEIIEMDFGPFYAVAEMLYEGAWVAERYAVIEDLLRDSPDSVYPVTRRIIEKALTFSAADVFRGFYRLQELKRRTAPLLAAVDLLCVPTIPTFYSLADLDADPVGPNSRLGTYTNFVNLLDLCALAVPTASRSDGRPGSVTLLAAAGEDARIAALGRLLQERRESLGATPWSAPPPEPLQPAAQPDEIALAVVGAHMSGLPLNGELTTRGGRFLRATRTTPCYRLYSLPGGPPLRPGLLRDDSAGAAIELEVWALPSEHFGDFLRDIPAPLGIGTLRLEDGQDVKGFLCEADATRRAEDITAFGGWRAYLAARTQKPANEESDHA